MNVKRISRVEILGSRSTLGSRPERLTILVLGINWEHVEQVKDLVVEELIEVLTSH